jgi:NADH-quinone oxidoreductase subunit N
MRRLRRDALGTEATMKFFLIGALSSVTMVIGITILFGAAGTTSYRLLATAVDQAPHAAVVAGVVAILAGLLFKAGAVPMHFWLPDAAQGATTPGAAFITTVPKVGALAALLRLFAQPLRDAPLDWPLLVAVISAATMTLGNLAAFSQTDVRRLLGYSTISQTGYMLMAVAVAARSHIALPALLLYLAAYAAANLGAFAVVAELPHARVLRDYSGLVQRHRGLALSLVVCLLALVGTPPTIIFFGKLNVFSAAADGGLAWLVVVAAVNTVASLFYYLRWIAPAFQGPVLADGATLQPAGLWSGRTAYAAALVVVASGLASGPALALFTGALASG